MVFSSTVFLFLFLPALLICYYLPVGKGMARRRWRNGVLLLFSVGFYAWGEPVFVFIMLGSVLINWFIGLQIEKGRNARSWMIGATVLDVLLLGVFKYASFLSENLAALTGNDALIIQIALPIGISFFTFQMMSYIFDVYNGTCAAQKNPLYVALYITLFPQLIAGPIVRYQDVEYDILNRRENLKDFSAGLQRFIYGLGKKVLVANFVAQIADNVFDATPNPSVLTAWLGAITYTLQGYFDFSGYSDMAIGLGRMFGFHFLENFNYPFISKSITEFWTRWHISLGTWFSNYVYYPAAMSKRLNKARKWLSKNGHKKLAQKFVPITALFIVWLLTGIWHGANWTFLLWGMVYFLFLLLEKTTGFTRKIGGFGHVYTLLVVVFTEVIFRSANIGSAVTYMGHMIGIGANGFCDAAFGESIKGSYVILLAALVGSTPLVAKLMAWFRTHKLAWAEYLWLLLVFAVSLLEIIGATYNPFIYFNF